jgi:hypothetical protein
VGQTAWKVTLCYLLSLALTLPLLVWPHVACLLENSALWVPGPEARLRARRALRRAAPGQGISGSGKTYKAGRTLRPGRAGSCGAAFFLHSSPAASIPRHRAARWGADRPSGAFSSAPAPFRIIAFTVFSPFQIPILTRPFHQEQAWSRLSGLARDRRESRPFLVSLGIDWTPAAARTSGDGA